MEALKDGKNNFLTCERDWVYFTLIFVAGFWGAYTYLLRGNVFCNAQTGNVVLMGLALGSAKWGSVLSGPDFRLYFGGLRVRACSQSAQASLLHTVGYRIDVH